jgi:TldD protein
VRAVSGEKTGFSYSDAINKNAITQAALAARSVATKTSQPIATSAIKVVEMDKQIIQPLMPVASISDSEKIDLLKQMDAYIKQIAPDAQQVVCSVAAVYEEVLIAASDGTFATDIRPLIRLNTSVLIEKDGKRERGGAGGGARLDYGYFYELENGQPRWMNYADEAVRLAKVNLCAIDAPAGTMPVVLGSGWPGVLLHEAVGHGLEGDFNRKGSSAFSGKVGEQVASSLCTIVDDGTIDNRRGSLNVDDEGVKAQYNVLIEDGILKGYMQDKLNARLMGVEPTGNGRRESYAHLPMPRMTNTYMLAGQSTQQDIIESVEQGIFATNFAGGQVDITSGKFVFSASEAYLIENGKVTTPIKGATLIGNGPDAMHKISMVGNDLSLDKGIGVCGKDGQSVPVGVGQPSLKIDELTVGGTAA